MFRKWIILFSYVFLTETLVLSCIRLSQNKLSIFKIIRFILVFVSHLYFSYSFMKWVVMRFLLTVALVENLCLICWIALLYIPLAFIRCWNFWRCYYWIRNINWRRFRNYLNISTTSSILTGSRVSPYISTKD